MSQPIFIQKTDNSSASASSLTLTPGAAVTAGNAVLVGVLLNTNGSQSPQTIGGITDSAGATSGVPVNNWISLGSNTNNGIRMEWWACKGAASITSLVIHLTGLQSIIAVAVEYSGVNGMTLPVFQSLQANQNTISSLHIHETASTFPNSGAELMLGLFAMLSDTFNTSPLEGTNRSTNSFSIPPALSYQVLEQGTVDSTGLLNVNAVSATQLATPSNVASCTMQCFYILISGGLVLNTQPGFSDQPDSSLAAGQYARGLQIAKISGNAALGMCRMEFFQGVYTSGETVPAPVSAVDGYQYSRDELNYVWGVFSTIDANGTPWATNLALWFAEWSVDQETGEVYCEEFYRDDAHWQKTNAGVLQVFTIGQRQRDTLTAAVSPTWTQKQSSDFVQDLAYAEDLLVALNNDSKMAVIGQECIYMTEFHNGQTVPTPVSPADNYAYSYSEVKFIYSWRWTTDGTQYVAPPWNGGSSGKDWNLASLKASVSSVGVVACTVGFEGRGGDDGYHENTSFGRISVWALCQRAKSGTPSGVANNFAEIPNTLLSPGDVLPAGIGAQLWKNIQEAALSPEFFGPTLYAPGATIPTPTSAVDGYPYKRDELTYIWEWAEMTPGTWPPGGSDHLRCAMFSAAINQSTGVVSDDMWRLAPGGPYDEYVNTYGSILVTVVGFRTSQQTALSGSPTSAPPSDAGSTVADQNPPGPITVNGV